MFVESIGVCSVGNELGARESVTSTCGPTQSSSALCVDLEWGIRVLAELIVERLKRKTNDYFVNHWEILFVNKVAVVQKRSYGELAVFGNDAAKVDVPCEIARVSPSCHFKYIRAGKEDSRLNTRRIMVWVRPSLQQELGHFGLPKIELATRFVEDGKVES